jgi:catechol 2,3-dioxygenase-like lactoylglutathione lyase family enzyme
VIDPASPTISRTAAQIFVADITASCRFYEDHLGFETVFVYGSPPFYAQIKRGGGLVNLRQLDTPAIDPQRRDHETLLSADFSIDDTESLTRLFLEFQGKATPFFQGLQREPWGALTFIVHDPDGNLLLFAAPASQAIVECVR